MKRKSVALFLSAAMMIGTLAGCAAPAAPAAAPADAPAKEEAVEEAPAEAEAPAEEEAAPSGEKVTIDFWDMVVGGDNYPAEAAEHAKKISEEYPNIEIAYESIPWANRYETFTTAIASGQAPDMSTGGGYQSFQYAASGEILDVGSIVDEWKEDGTYDNYNTAMIDYFQYNGQQVGIPWNYEPRYMLYRADWFEADGIEPPTTWDEIMAAAEHFTDPANGKYGLAYPTSGSSGNVLFNIWFGMNGSGIWAEDGQSLDWTNEKNVEALDFIRELNKAGVFPEGLGAYESNEVVQLAVQDSVAMVIIVGGSSGVQIADAGFGDKFQYLDVPAGPSADGNNGYVTAINAIMAYSQTETPQETKDALKWWSENMIDLWTSKTAQVNGIPVRNDWLESEVYLDNIADPYMIECINRTINKGQMHTLIYPASNIVGWQTQNAFDGERWWTALSQAVLTADDGTSSLDLLQERQDDGNELLKELDGAE